MASIFKRPGSNVWQAQYYVKNPGVVELRQVRKSTGKTNRKEAMAVAVELERAAQGVMAAGSDRAQRAKAVLAEAVAEIERETFTQLSARKYLADLLAIATGEEMPAFTVATWFDEWLRRKARASSKATMARYRGHLDAFRAWLGPVRAGKPLESVTATEARRWREALQDEGRAGKTVLAYTKDVAAAYRAAIREGLTNTNPFTGLDAIDTSDSHDRKPFTAAEVAALLGAAPTWEWRGLILVAAFTGLRLGDAARLSWEAIDMQAKRITLVPSKTRRKKREVRIPIQPDLMAFLESVPIHSDEPAAKVFPTLSETPVFVRSGLSRRFLDIMEQAGVDRGKASRSITDEDRKAAAKEGRRIAGRVTYERGFHSLRHTFTAWLRSAGVSEEDRMALTGHTTRESHAIYSHEDEAALRDAIAKLPTMTLG
ncbi:MAG: tyrosine-type recombinase/integrase [Akkermansiaceae bacterium]|nr:tyrosine-type recombinase/integrase [Akkermansiaceae bacterium]